MTCKWCGDEHGVEQLCQRAQRGMTRRSFLFLTAAGVAGTIIAPTLAETLQFTHTVYPPPSGVNVNLGQMVAETWNRIIGDSPGDNLFVEKKLFAKLFADDIKRKLGEA